MEEEQAKQRQVANKGSFAALKMTAKDKGDNRNDNRNDNCRSLGDDNKRTGNGNGYQK